MLIFFFKRASPFLHSQMPLPQDASLFIHNQATNARHAAFKMSHKLRHLDMQGKLLINSPKYHNLSSITNLKYNFFSR